MIDLHLHTTASDGRLSPEALVNVAAGVGLRTLAVADHDTVGALDRTARACSDAGIAWVPGIEITSIRDKVDLHILGYFFDHRSPALTTFLAEQVADRQRRLCEMIARLAALGLPISLEEVLGGRERSGTSWVGRPLLAAALVRKGYVGSTTEAFERYLAEDGAAFVPRRAEGPAAVIGLIHEAGGLASLAHPGLNRRDEWIESLAASGLDAVEVYYSQHTPEMTGRYHDLARRLGLAMTGGSDYHGGSSSHGPAAPGATTLPDEAFANLKARL